MLMENISQELKHQIGQFQQIQQQAQLIVVQKQNMELQLKEVSNALSELEKAEDDVKLYKSIGSLFISAKKDPTVEELKEMKESLEIRVSSLKKQEEQITNKLKEMEKKISQKLQGTGQEPIQAG